MRQRGFGMLTILLILVIIFGVKGTVMSMENRQCAGRNYYDAALEEEYVDRMKQLLTGEGYRNCGVTMRRITYGDGNREYILQIHHRKLGRLSEQEKTALERRLSETEFMDETCRFIYEL